MSETIVRDRQKAGLGPDGLLAFVFEFLAMCWPVALNSGQPILFSDTRGYYVAGQAAVVKAGSLFAPHMDGSGGGLDIAIQKARAVRSAFYSVFIYLAGGTGSLWPAILVQAIIVVMLLRLLFNLMCPGQSRGREALFIGLVAACTTASWTTATAMPDVFTAIAVLCVIVVALFWDQLPSPTLWTLLLTLSASVVMHLSNLPITVGVLGVGVLLLIRFWPRPMRFALIGAAILLGACATLGVSVVGFKQWTLAPNQLPFLLARSLEDGPGRLYLQEHCPQIGLDMCKHLDRLYLSVDDFVWHENGVYSLVSLEEAALLRSEDKRIYIAAALEHPWMQAGAIVRNTLRQLGLFTLDDFYIPSFAYFERSGGAHQQINNQPMVKQYDYVNPTAIDMAMYLPPDEPTWEVLLAVPEYLVVIVSVSYAVYSVRLRRIPRDVRDFFALICAAVVINAFVVVFSEPTARYGARVIWLVPMASLLLLLQRDSLVKSSAE